ncbi:peptidoglycan-binding protein [Streptomyces sp. N2-109]|uniref:Peptidoglycan-binding protein n=1 Tax=Streptomyces gossypii TaxID=2883101 RepID=A0ABT2K009_9ACTN|nr:peptidoglycan-binding protein [Streptomyces gossypii]MCT2593507.1 peptidoglycan-binding protein [Streptomyces gossypii]
MPRPQPGEPEVMGAEELSGEGPPRPRRRGRTLAVVAILVVLAAGGATVGFGGERETESRRSDLPPATAVVTRTDLAQQESVPGTLGYGDAKPLPGGAAGTVTWLPRPGATISIGEPVLNVDGRKVPLLYGGTPLFRELKPGVEGPDVRQLESSLSRLGYVGFTVDDEYTFKTAQALKRWQKHLGLKETGTLDAGDAVVARGKVRVVSLEAQPGQTLQPGATVMQYTGTERQISIDLDTKKQKLVHKNDKVTVTLPDAARVTGTITSVGTVATREGSGDDQGDGDSKSVIKVTVGVDRKDRDRLGTYDGAPVDVGITSVAKKGVLTVPISALLALAEGGYGVEVVDNDRPRVVAVKTGLFARGRVEITGEGLEQGDKVGVPK